MTTNRQGGLPVSVKALDQMLALMSPDLGPLTYVFVTIQQTPERLVPLMAFHEDEGLTLIVTDEQAREHGWAIDDPMKRITLRVHSALDAVGLTGAFSSALSAAGISCNVVAGYYHDHLFVPEADAHKALVVLRELSAQHRRAETSRTFSVTAGLVTDAETR